MNLNKFTEINLANELHQLKEVAEDKELRDALDFLRSLLGDIPSFHDWKDSYQRRNPNAGFHDCKNEYFKRFPQVQESLWEKLK